MTLANFAQSFFKVFYLVFSIVPPIFELLINSLLSISSF